MVKDLTNKTFGELIALNIFGKTKSNSLIWRCVCSCGNEKNIISSSLISGKTKSCGCLRSRKSVNFDFIGTTFNNLEVVGFSHKYKNRNYWLCKCQCGNISSYSTNSLQMGVSTKCKECGRNYKSKGHSGVTILIKQYKHDAKKRGYDWDLSREFVKEITSKNCFYCGCKPSNVINTRTKYNHGNYTYNGIDRYDNNIGYIKENVVPCCGTCNYMKSNMNVFDFEKHIVKIYKKMKDNEASK